MITKSLVIRRSFLALSVGVLLFASDDRCLSQDAEQQEHEFPQIRILLGAKGLDVVSPAIKMQALEHTEQPMLPPGTESLSELYSPDNLGIGRRSLNPLRIQSEKKSNPETKYFREQISQQIDFLAQQGNDVQQLRELVERLQLAMDTSEQRTARDIEVAVFAVPEAAQEGSEGSQNSEHPRAGISFTAPPPAGPPGFGPPGFVPPRLRMGGRPELHPGQGPQIRHTEAHGPEGPFAEDRRRIAALTESAERITQAGLPDVAHGLRERAGQLEKELAEKQARMRQEEQKRAEAEMRELQEQVRQHPQRLMEQRREGIERGDHAAPPLRELHEQMEKLRRDMHKLSEQMADLTRLIQQHHNPRTDRGHHEDMEDDEDADDEDADDEDADDEDADDE
ncbi:MAG: hypothetical protein WKF77_31945, partial [Planctomycetaceae bacterium]